MITWFKKSNFEFRNTNFEFSYTHVHVNAVYKLSENNTKAFKVVFFNFIALVSSRHVKTIYLHLWRNYVDVIYITEYKNPHKIELVHVILELIKKIVFQKTFPLFGRCGLWVAILMLWRYDKMKLEGVRYKNWYKRKSKKFTLRKFYKCKQAIL